MADFTHFDKDGRARMVDVGDKDVSCRTAVAAGRVLVNRETFDLIRSGGIKKGEEELLFLEEKLGLAARHSAITESAKKLLSLAEALKADSDDEKTKALLDEIVRCTDAVLYKEKED